MCSRMVDRYGSNGRGGGNTRSRVFFPFCRLALFFKTFSPPMGAARFAFFLWCSSSYVFWCLSPPPHHFSSSSLLCSPTQRAGERNTLPLTCPSAQQKASLFSPDFRSFCVVVVLASLCPFSLFLFCALVRNATRRPRAAERLSSLRRRHHHANEKKKGDDGRRAKNFGLPCPVFVVFHFTSVSRA